MHGKATRFEALKQECLEFINNAMGGSGQVPMQIGCVTKSQAQQVEHWEEEEQVNAIGGTHVMHVGGKGTWHENA